MLEVMQALDEHFLVYLTSLMAGVAVVSTIFRTCTSIVTVTARERTRREIAAYIAEGTISPEQGERLLRVEIDSASGRRC